MFLESCFCFSIGNSVPDPVSLTFNATWNFDSLLVINWSMLEPCPWLPDLIRLSPQDYDSYGAENAAAILQSPSTSLVKLTLSRLDMGNAVSNLIERISRRPFANSLTKLRLHVAGQRYPGHYIRCIAKLPRLLHLSLNLVDCSEEDVLFVVENTSLKTLSLMCLFTISHHFYEKFFRTCFNIESFEFVPCRVSLQTDSRSVVFPVEGLNVANLKSFILGNDYLANSAHGKSLMRFEAQFFDMLGSGRFLNLTSLKLDLRAFCYSYLLLLFHGCPLLEKIKIDSCQGSALNVKEPFVLQCFPQGWKGLKEICLNGNVDVTFNGLMSIAKSSRRLRVLTVKTAQSVDEEQRWAREVKKLFPALNITFAEDEEIAVEEENEQNEDGAM